MAAADTRHACKRYALHKCGHDEQNVSAAECLLAQLGRQCGMRCFNHLYDAGPEFPPDVVAPRSSEYQ